MGQKDGEKWTAAVDLQPTISKSDRLLGACARVSRLLGISGGAIAGKKEAARHFAYEQSPESVDHVIADAAAPTAAI